MLAIECPRCGRPTRVALRQPNHLRCLACHYEGPPAASGRSAIETAARVLSAVDVRQRQLSERQRRTLSRMRRRRWILLSLLLLALAVLAPCAVCGLTFLTGRAEPIFTIACASPFVLLATTGSFIVLWSFRNRRRLENACAAIPPDVPGEPAACHVCGGPLEAVIEEGGFVRCEYCAADNLVASDVLDRQARRKVGDVRQLDVEVRRQATLAGLESGVSCVVVVIVALAAPLVCLGTGFGLMTWSQSVEEPVSLVDRYVAVDTPDGQCIARISQLDATGRRHLFLSGVRDGYDGTLPLDAGVTLPPSFDANAIVGRRVRYQHGRDWIGGPAVRVYNPALASGNMALLATPEGEERVVLEKLCFEQPQLDLEALPWPASPQPAADASAAP